MTMRCSSVFCPEIDQQGEAGARILPSREKRVENVDVSTEAQRVVVFDLDDTLVRYGRRKIVVPRETWHALRRLSESGTRVFIVSFNSLAPFLAAQFDLYRYAEGVVSGAPPRDALLRKLVSAHPDVALDDGFVYVDDRDDNICQIKNAWPSAVCIKATNTVRCSDFSNAHREHGDLLM